MLETVSKLSYSLRDEEKAETDFVLKIKANDIKKEYGFDEPYYQFSRRYLQNIVKNDYKIKDLFKQRKYKNSSRLYGVGMSLQSISNNIISMIFGDTSYDIDMVNASFNFLKFINHKYFKEENNIINDYCINRKDYLDDKHDKQFFISALFHSNTKQLINSYNNKKQNDLLKAIDDIKIKIGENIHKFNLDFDEGLHLGQKVVKIIHHYESKLLLTIIPEYQKSIKTLKHDGLVIDDEVDLEQTLDYCNKKGEEYGITFINKPFPQVPNFKLEEEKTPAYSEKSPEYVKMKKEFEESHFMCLNPLMYYHQEGDMPEEYIKKDFKDLIKPFQLPAEKGTKDFFDEWLKDKDRRTYKKMVWRPSLEKVDGEYNYFKGFPAKLIPDGNYDESKEKKYVGRFTNHILHLCGDDVEAFNHVVKYIAHLLQKPCERPDSFIIMVSDEGTGKDFLIDILELIVGKGLVYRDCNMNNITGNFNEGLEHKLILQMNEVNGKDGHTQAGNIKDLITRNTHNINKKYGKKTIEKNFLRGFCFTNVLNGMKVEAQSRRFLVCKSNDPKPKKYYEKLAECKSEEGINYIYTWFKKYDISKWNPTKNIPKTDYHMKLVQANTNHYYKFLHNIINDPTEYGVRKNKRDELHYIKTADLNRLYKDYAETNEITTPMKKDNISLILNRENFKECRMNIKGQPQARGYKFNMEEVKTKFDKKFGNDDNLDEADFSEEEDEFLEDDY